MTEPKYQGLDWLIQTAAGAKPCPDEVAFGIDAAGQKMVDEMNRLWLEMASVEDKPNVIICTQDFLEAICKWARRRVVRRRGKVMVWYLPAPVAGIGGG